MDEGGVTMSVDVLIIRNNCDDATQWTNWIGEGLATHLKDMGISVTDLNGVDASPANVTNWLTLSTKNTTKFVIGLDHGSCSAFYGQDGAACVPVIDAGNVEDLTKDLHIYTFACSTNGDGCIGETAVSKGCLSWLGYIEPVYVFLSAYMPLKECIWSYIDALVSGKTVEQAEQVLRKAYQDRVSLHWVFQYNLDRLLLRKAKSNMTMYSYNRFSGWRQNKKILALYSCATCGNGNGYVYVSDLGWRRLDSTYPDNVNTLMTMAAHAKSNDREVYVYEYNSVIKNMYVW
jgi:hypothetical protein